MHAALRLAVVLCAASIVARRVLLYSFALAALMTNETLQICSLSASLKLTAGTCGGLVEQALRIEKDAFAKIKDTEESLRAASRRVTEVDTKLATLPDALRGLQADLMVAERSVDDAWSKYDTLRAGVRALVRRAAALVPKAASAAGRIDNFITAFATADSHKNFSCITEHGVSYTLEYESAGSRQKVPSPPATLHSNLTGCTYENYTLAHPQNVTTTIVDDVVTLGKEGMLCMSSYSIYFKDSKGKACPFLISDFVREGGTPMNWGGFWVAERLYIGTVIRFNREKRPALLAVARELSKLEWLLSNGSRYGGGWPRAYRRTTKTIHQLAADVDGSLLIVRHGAGPANNVKNVVDALVKEVEGVQTIASVSEPKSSLPRRPERRRRGRRTTSATATGNEGSHMSTLFLLCFFKIF
ncbi:hypothetical protein ERJ75_000164600 [Trypanosoma vivax]|uniref:Uncharacterized protein n=1 Tax=Trypanosoma vivax (strain Y486) TaxID=1055687 RepID=F9WM20_TRYVY|nr:hypothetical protein ERJ75_000164600 [Trypanosoma vivax]CCD18570.1 hypothetical protein, conserved in T. vivax [Trypanosoma vivax Y486]|eukprot:CCD18570.1 hypothetical protein, conserved in T. vivax [Trypanosoma vivax Y486]